MKYFDNVFFSLLVAPVIAGFLSLLVLIPLIGPFFYLFLLPSLIFNPQIFNENVDVGYFWINSLDTGAVLNFFIAGAVSYYFYLSFVSLLEIITNRKKVGLFLITFCILLFSWFLKILIISYELKISMYFLDNFLFKYFF